jgi:hypothetical protein
MLGPAASPPVDPAEIDGYERLVYDLGAFDRELRRHPLGEPWEFRAMVFAGARAAGLAGLAVDGGRLLASAAQLPVAVFRGDEGQHYALRHVMIQGAWFAAAKQHAGNIDALLEHGPKAETLGPWALAHFQWSVAELAHCIEALAASPPGLRGALIGAWDWSKGQGDPMALTIALPIVLHARGFSAIPLPGLFGQVHPGRLAQRWIGGMIGDLAASVASMTGLLHGLERARRGLTAVLAGVRASSRLPVVAELALTVPAIAAPLVVRHLTRLARRNGPTGRTSPEIIRKRKTAVSRQGAGKMLRQLADTGWLVELTGSGSHRAYVLRDLADLGISMQPARLRPRRRMKPEIPEAEPVAIPPLPTPDERLAPVDMDLSGMMSDLQGVEMRIAAVLDERGLRRRSATTTEADSDAEESTD